MNWDLIILGGYGQFVWPAFLFTFSSCAILLIKTKKELKEQEKMFSSEYQVLLKTKVQPVEQKRFSKKILSNNPI